LSIWSLLLPQEGKQSGPHASVTRSQSSVLARHPYIVHRNRERKKEEAVKVKVVYAGSHQRAIRKLSTHTSQSPTRNEKKETRTETSVLARHPYIYIVHRNRERKKEEAVKVKVVYAGSHQRALRKLSTHTSQSTTRNEKKETRTETNEDPAGCQPCFLACA
jgi:predicted dinucleotide-binding enzyme